MITYSHLLYGWLDPLLVKFEREGTPREAKEQAMLTAALYDVLLFGVGRFGGAVAQRLKARGLNVLAIDFNPAAVRRWRAEGFEVLYGDVTDPEFIANLPMAGVSWAVSAVPEHETGVTRDDSRLALIQTLRDLDFQGKIAVTSHRADDWERLRAVGAHLILQLFQDAADQAANLLAGQQPPPRFEVIEPEDQKELL